MGRASSTRVFKGGAGGGWGGGTDAQAQRETTGDSRETVGRRSGDTSLSKPSWTLKIWEKTPQAKLEDRFFLEKDTKIFFQNTPPEKLLSPVGFLSWPDCLPLNVSRCLPSVSRCLPLGGGDVQSVSWRGVSKKICLCIFPKKLIFQFRLGGLFPSFQRPTRLGKGSVSRPPPDCLPFGLCAHAPSVPPPPLPGASLKHPRSKPPPTPPTPRAGPSEQIAWVKT